MNVLYRVELSQTERAELTALLSGGKHAARKLKRAQVLLAADGGQFCQAARAVMEVKSCAHRSIRLLTSPPSKQPRAAVDTRGNFPGRIFAAGGVVLHRPQQQV